MLYRRFGRTGLDLSVFSCGGMRFQQSWSQGARVGPESQRNLEATLDRALEVGVNHIETARGYGTSESQLGVALARHPRDRYILQTKVQPEDDPALFERNLEESFARLRVDRVDLFAFHGLNNRASFDKTLRPGGCFEVAERFRRAGRIGHIGFSTHAPCRLIVEAIESGRFDYVNLHYYFILQDNEPAVAAASRRDMGVFIISPSDKGGRLYRAPEKLRRLCAPLSPIAMNDLFCLSRPGVHTLSVGAARPGDFDEHVGVLPLVERAAEVLPPIIEQLEKGYFAAVGEEFGRRFREGIRDWDEMPGQLNVKMILWLRNLALAYDLLPFARERYANLTGGDHWVPGANAASFDEAVLRRATEGSPFRRELPALLREAHALLWDPSTETLP